MIFVIFIYLFFCKKVLMMKKSFQAIFTFLFCSQCLQFFAILDLPVSLLRSLVFIISNIPVSLSKYIKHRSSIIFEFNIL